MFIDIKKKYYVGIDPGNLSGAISFIDQNNTYALSLSMKNLSLDEMINIFKIIKKNVLFVCVEKVNARSTDSKKSIWSFCQNYTRIITILATLDYHYSIISPLEWQAYLGCMDSSITGDYLSKKKLCVNIAKKTFSDVIDFYTHKKINITVNNADSLLIANFIRLKGNALDKDS